MIMDELSQAIKAKLHPIPYGLDVQPSGAFDFVIMRGSALPGGRYAFAFRRLGADSVHETYTQARLEARAITRSMWLFREVGLYLMMCGPKSKWTEETKYAPVDKTGFHNIIVQAVHFVDPETGENYLNQSSWGSIKFGGLIPVPEIVNEVIKGIPNKSIKATS